jgi:hypothetical protein
VDIPLTKSFTVYTIFNILPVAKNEVCIELLLDVE